MNLQWISMNFTARGDTRSREIWGEILAILVLGATSLQCYFYSF